jgi:predicted PurR-regulated permease PerM
MDASRLKVINDFAVGQRLTEIGHVVVVLLLLPVYIFLILHYKTLLLEFIRKLFRTEHHTTVVDVLAKSKSLIQTYLTGLLFEMAIVAVLNSVGLLILGIDYAIILGLIGAVLNIIPYIGGIIAIALPMTIAFITKDSALYPLLVLLLYMVIQLVDNNYIIPKIVAARVKLNALISIVVILIGGAIWGVPGMFLAIPLTAIAKVICDNIEPLKPWGYLLGNIVPVTSRFTFLKHKKIAVTDHPPQV